MLHLYHEFSETLFIYYKHKHKFIVVILYYLFIYYLLFIILKDNIEGLEEFKQWKLSPLMNDSSPFIKRILDEDIRPCLSFQNVEVSLDLVYTLLKR